MSGDAHPGSIRIALDVGDPTLRDRLAQTLSELDDVTLVPPGAPADVRVSEISDTVPISDGPELTPREVQVLLIMAEGASNREIAERLGISFHTAKFHVRSIMEKLDATGRVDAVAHAARLGVIHL